MARYKLIDRTPRFLAVVLEDQIQAGTFEFALDHLVDEQALAFGTDNTLILADAGYHSESNLK